MKTKIWDKISSINGVEAKYFIEDLKIQENDGVFLVLDDYDNIVGVELARIIKSVYKLDASLTTEEVAAEYLVKKKEEEEANNQAHLDEAIRNAQVDDLMILVVDLYEGMLINTVFEGARSTVSPALINTYVVLINRGLRTLDSVPESIRPQVEAVLNA